MPVYEFRCPECDDRFDVERPMGKVTGVCCPRCGSDAKRVFSASAVVFKGSGFHNTDYRSKPVSEVSTKAESKTPDSSASQSSEIKKKPKELPSTSTAS